MTPETEIPLSRCELEVLMIPTGMDSDGAVTLEADMGLTITATCDYELIRDAVDEANGQFVNVRVKVRLV